MFARRGFSLIELVIVVVILGIIGAIAIPRMSRGAKGAADSGLVADLAVLRNAIDLYAAEHNGTYPAGATVTSQLTLYSDIDGTTSATKTATAIYGPYLRAVPKLKVGPSAARLSTITTTDDDSGGWLYNASTGEITANLGDGETDASGTAYNTY